MKTFISFIIFLFFSSRVFSQDVIFSKNIDLNSDGVAEQITLKETEEDWVLTVNTIQKTIDYQYGSITGCQIVDINKGDAFKEIMVLASTPGGYVHTFLYWFDGKKLRLMNSLEASLTFIGNGIVYGNSFESFWQRRSRFTLNKTTHKLTETKQFAYYVGVKDITVKNYISIYSDVTLTQRTAVLSKNLKIEILLCKKSSSNYKEDLYLVKSKFGLIGWIKYSELEKNCTGFDFAG